MNNLQVDKTGNVINYKDAEKRAAQFVRSYLDATYLIEPALAEWECELHPVSKNNYIQ